jgi:hypothetical protein
VRWGRPRARNDGQPAGVRRKNAGNAQRDAGRKQLLGLWKRREGGNIDRRRREDLKDGARAALAEEHRVLQNANVGRRRRKRPPQEGLALDGLLWRQSDEVQLGNTAVHHSLVGACLLANLATPSPSAAA